jgi:multidrug efflux pump subunit AcrA (membrane-fusion protein)
MTNDLRTWASEIWRTRRRALLAVGAPLLGAVMLAVALLVQAARPKPDTVTLEDTALPMALIGRGNVAARRVTDVYATATGTIIWIAEEGADVKAGDPVVRLDSSQIDSQIEDKVDARVLVVHSLEDSQENLKQLRQRRDIYERLAAITKEEADELLDDLKRRPRSDDKARALNRLDSAKIRRDDALRDRDRFFIWRDQGIVSDLAAQEKELAFATADVEYAVSDAAFQVIKVPPDLDIAEAEQRARLARIDLERARNDWKDDEAIAGQDVAVCAAQLDRFDLDVKDLRRQSESCVVRVPAGASGKVALVDTWKGDASEHSPIRVGEEINNHNLLLKIADTSSLRVEMVLNEADALAARACRTARVRLEAYPDVDIPGRVARIGAVAEDKNVLLGGLTMVYRGAAGVGAVTVYIDLDVPKDMESLIRLGYSDTVFMEGDAPAPVPSLPQSAVAWDDQGPWCRVLSGGSIEVRRIETGASTAERIEVRSGLDRGEKVLRNWMDEEKDIKKQ